MWHLASSEPITVESARAVVSEDGGAGFCRIRWSGFNQPELCGPVVRRHPNSVIPDFEDSEYTTAAMRREGFVEQEIMDSCPQF